MTLDFFDTKLSPIRAARVLSQHVHDAKFPYETAAVVGGASSSVSGQMAILNGIRQIPQVSYASSSAQLDNKYTYPLFGRVICPNDGNAIAAVEFLQKVLNATHFGKVIVSWWINSPLVPFF
jgi:ABC-type branched-subunit amino acid transport system substrate-binding protein